MTMSCARPPVTFTFQDRVQKSSICVASQVAGQSILPAAAMFEAAAAASGLAAISVPAGESCALMGVIIAAPLRLSSRGNTLLDIALDATTGTIAAHSLNLLTTERQLNMRAAAGCCLAAAQAQREGQDEPPHWHAALLQQAAVDMRRFNGSAVAELDVTGEQAGSGFITHPAVADSCLHTGALFTVPHAGAADNDSEVRCRTASFSNAHTSCIDHLRKHAYERLRSWLLIT